MKLHVLGSSSKGNCYILENEKEALVIECGLPLLEVKKALNFNISKIAGVLVSHEHGDHAKYVSEFLASRIRVFASMGTIHKKGLVNNSTKFYPIQLKSKEKQRIGDFMILPFDVKHDAEEPIGFLITHSETGNILFATDTYYLPYRFEKLSNILIECNYRIDILERNIEQGRIPVGLKNRTLQSHMSFDTCKDTLLANDLSLVNNIVLIHLSDGNSDSKQFRDDIHQSTGKVVHIAEKGLIINFDKTPF